jgi:hypothetical protein
MDNKVSNKEFEAQLLAQAQGQTVANDGAKLLTDRLHDLFGGDDLVKINNFTKRIIGWVYCDRKGTRVEQPNEFTRRVTQGPQKARSVNPGKSIVIPGWEAFVALNRFYEDWAKHEKADSKVSYVLSGVMQQEFLGKAFGGIVDVDDLNAEPVVDVKKEVEDDLGLTDGKEEPQKSATTKKK